MPEKVKEFWETEEWKKRFTQPSTPAYQPPDVDVAQIQAGAIAPLREEYERAVPAIASRLAKRHVGRSSAYEFEERKLLRDFMTQAGAISSDVALRGAQLELEAAKLGLTQQQFEERLNWEREQFHRTLTTDDERFDRQMELEWRRQDLSEQEIADKKQMFYDELKFNEQMFDREYTFKETQAMEQAKQEWAKIGLTEEQIKNEMYKFDKELAWQMEHFDRSLTWEQTKSANELSFRMEELAQTGELEWAKVNEMARQFDDALKQTAWIENARMDLQERQMLLENDLQNRRITIEQYNSETARLAQQARDGWTDDDGVYHPGIADQQLEIERTKNQIMNDEIFGYWDEGFGPENAPPKYDEPPQFDEFGNPIPTDDWKLYMDLHYHPGALDLKEWEIRIDGMLGLRGVSNVEGPQTPSEKWNAIDRNNKRIEDLQRQIDTASLSFPQPSQEQLNAMQAEIDQLKTQNEQWQSQMGGGGI